jgi:purine-binding chemotaxis protein CheW
LLTLQGNTFAGAPVDTDLTRQQTTPLAVARSTIAGKHMCFQLGAEIYGLPILDVREIIGLMTITPVPRAPAFVRGVINLRGKVIPVVDLRLQFGMEPCPATDQTVIIVVQCSVDGQPLTMGLLVDRVLEVLSIGSDQIEPPPSFGASGGADFLLGVGKSGKRVVFLLDIARLLSSRDRAALAESAQA